MSEIPNPMPWFEKMQGPDVSTELRPDGTRVDNYVWMEPPHKGTFTLDWSGGRPPIANDGSVKGAVNVALAARKRAMAGRNGSH